MKKPPMNKYFKTTAYWRSYSTDGDPTDHGPDAVIAVRYDKDNYSFIHKRQSYLYETLGDFTEWELV